VSYPIVCRIGKIKSLSQLALAHRHNHRTAPAENADPERTHLNRVLVGSSDLVADVNLALARVDGPIRKNAVLAIEMILTANAAWFEEAAAPTWRAEYFQRQAVDALRARYGDRLVSVVLHLDEAAPHLHAVIVPLERKDSGKIKLNARGEFGGAEALRRLQDWAGEFAETVGLHRGVPRIYEPSMDPRRHKSPKAYRAELDREAERLALERAQVESDRQEIARSRDEIDDLLTRAQHVHDRVTAIGEGITAFAAGEIEVSRDGKRLLVADSVSAERRAELSRVTRPASDAVFRLISKVSAAIKILPVAAQRWVRQQLHDMSLLHDPELNEAIQRLRETREQLALRTEPKRAEGRPRRAMAPRGP